MRRASHPNLFQTLVSVTADLAPNGPKILYDSDYVIVQGDILYEADYVYEADKLFFDFRKLPRAHRIFPDTLVFKGDKLKQRKLRFAIDTYFYGEDELKRNLCDQKSSPGLRKLVESCSNRTVVRELTPEEQKQLETFKAERWGKEFGNLNCFQ